MGKHKYWKMEMAANSREADLYIFGDITSFRLMENEVSSYSLVKELKDLDVDHINVHINSYGGEVAEGFAIYNTLMNHRAIVTTYCDGFACSAASLVFMAGDERIMNPLSMLMIHNASMATVGNAEDLRQAADLVENISKLSSRAYMDRVSISEEELSEMMARDTWIAPDDAVAMGFATAVSERERAGYPEQSAQASVFQAVRMYSELQGYFAGRESREALSDPERARSREPENAPVQRSDDTLAGRPANHLTNFLGALSAHRKE